MITEATYMITITTCHYLESASQGKVMEATELGNRPWKEEDDSVTVSDTQAICETDNCNDLLYMYTTKNMVKVENDQQIYNLSSQNKPWKQYSQSKATTHIIDISAQKEALIYRVYNVYNVYNLIMVVISALDNFFPPYINCF